MISVLQDKLYDDGNYSALVKVYGVEYSINTLEDGEYSIRCTQNRQYVREPQWKKDSRIKKINEFIKWRMAI